jgi:hypothetical protein
MLEEMVPWQPPSAGSRPVPIGSRSIGVSLHASDCRWRRRRAARTCRGVTTTKMLELGGLTQISAIRTHHVSTYVEMLTRNYSAPTVKQHLAAIRRLFDWLIVGQVIDQNPAATGKLPATDACYQIEIVSAALQCRRRRPLGLARRAATHTQSVEERRARARPAKWPFGC